MPNDELMVKERGEYPSRVIRVKRRIMAKERGKHTAAQVSGVWGKQMEIETVTLKRDQRTPALHYTGYLVQTVC